jgi:uncharacterized protein (TIGR00255 family)
MVLSSMTGFGRASGQLSERYSASVVARSVNHRYLDVQVRTSVREEVPELEAAVRSVVSEALERGRVTVQIDLGRSASARTVVTVDGDAVTSVLEQLGQLQLPEEVADSVSLRDVLAVPGLVSVNSEETLLDEGESGALQRVARDAVDRLLVMRREEGAHIAAQLEDGVDELDRFLDWFEPQMEEFRERILGRLHERLERLLGSDAGIDPERLAQEAAVMADRSDVTEEVVRLRAHLAGFRARFGEGGAVGRELDFLCQEIHRELNTLGSKCREVGVGERMVEAKATTERLREQVQNLE